MINFDDLNPLLAYDCDTGEFVWRVSRGRVTVGERAGWVTKGRRYIRALDRVLLASRVAWLLETGAWPNGEIDHRNTDKLDDRFANLREATRSQNEANKGKSSHNTTGFKGVTTDKRRAKPYVAKIQKDGRVFYVGYFSSAEEAHAARCATIEKYHGEFARAA